MVFSVLTVVVVIASGDAADGATSSLDRALRSALPEHTDVVVQRDEPQGARPSTWVVRIEWTDHDHRAIVRTSDGLHSTEREIRFDDGDSPVERGRTVGFALASMVPDELLSPLGAVTAPSRLDEPIARPPTPDAPPALIRDSRPTRFHVELLGQGATGVGGTAGGLGGALGARLLLKRGFHLRAAVGLRLGEVPTAQATSRVVAPSLGVGWRTSLSEAFALGARLEALLVHQYVAHFSPDDPEPVGWGRFLPGAGARIEGAFRVADRTAVMLAFGPEVAFGTTRLYVVGVEVDRIPPLRMCGEVGLTLEF